MPDQERLKRAWKLHQRSLEDTGHEAETAAVLRDKILSEEGVSLEQLETRFAEVETVPPFGRPFNPNRNGDAFTTGGGAFTGGPFSAFGGFGFGHGGIDPDLQEQMRRAAEEQFRRRAEAQFREKRQRYQQFQQQIQELFEQLGDVYSRTDADLALLKNLTECMQDLTTSDAQLTALAERVDAGDLESKASQQQAFRTLTRAMRKQSDTLSKLVMLMTTLVGGRAVQQAAARFRNDLGRRP